MVIWSPVKFAGSELMLEVLIMQERDSVPSLSGKLLTDFIFESGEILQGVVREVKEETGIHTEFEEVRTFSHLQWSNSCFRLQ
ncbi:hypothetical protein KY289_009897 [Solanum tuberosum]|nr:hypothetical protein KY289_009897 [Solanum tuberosum]